MKNAPETEVQAYADFLFMKRRTGFAFDYSPEIAKGRIITLREDIGRRINVTDDIKSSENKLIIGDNYNALKALLITHKNSIDIIYIDPPYNTESAKNDGNNDSYKDGSSSKFIYKDKFGRCGWLNMMKDRLTLAKDLLTNDGVIFVSIDDSEQAYLKVLMDDIFGEEHFVGNLAQDKQNSILDQDFIQSNHDYVLVYSKNIQKLSFGSDRIRQNKIYEDNIGKFILKGSITNGNKDSILKKHHLCGYTIYYNSLNNDFIPVNDYNFEAAKKYSTEEDRVYLPSLERYDLILKGYIKIRPPKRIGGALGRWTWSFENFVENKEYIYINKNNKIEKKHRILTKLKVGDYFDLITEKSNIRSIINLDTLKYSSSNGANILTSIFGFNIFEITPKNINLIKYLINLNLNKNAIILDFFAGSGTTGHAVMDLNKDDGGNRKFILVTNNENNIAHDITYERLHRIIKGKGTENEKDFKWIKKNEAYKNSELRVINIDDSVRISLDAKIHDNVFEDCKNGLKLLNNKYNKKDLNLYYDLAALNPLEKDCE